MRGPSVLIPLVVGAACTAGCTKSGATECRAAVGDLRATLRAFDEEAAHESSSHEPGDVVRLSADASTVPLPVGAEVVSLARSFLIVRGMPAGSASDPTATRRALERARLEAKERPQTTTTIIVFVVRPDTTFRDVAVSTNAAAEAGYTRLSFAFEAPRRISPPPPTRVARTLAEEHPPAHPTSVDFVYERCPDVGRALAGFSSESMTPEEKIAKLTARVPDGIERCGCKVDLAEVKDLAWHQRLLDRPRAVYVALDVVPNGQAGCSKISATPDEPWSRASSLVTAAAARGGPSCFALP